MKVESLVIISKYIMVNIDLVFAHTACHAMEEIISKVKKYNKNIKYFFITIFFCNKIFKKIL